MSKTEIYFIKFTTQAISGTAVDAGMFKYNHSGGHWNIFNKQVYCLVINQILLSRGHHYIGLFSLECTFRTASPNPPPHPLSGFWGQGLHLLMVPPPPIQHQACLFLSVSCPACRP